MKNLVRTVSVEVNGKKVDIRFLSDPEIIKEVNNSKEKGAILCKHCKLFSVCEKLKDPYHPSNNNYSFVDFCISASIGIDSRDFDVNKRLTLKELEDKIKNNNPKLYEALLNSGKESFNLAEVIFEFSEEEATLLLPCYEDIEPILEDLKI